ncbi:MAG: protein kinase domain-containing protein [Akkermansiaceae bacterium]
MTKTVRPDPIIPDHEVLRKVGGGAYGEVWLARAVTGTMRAVKIVYREDFSDERTFEREFKGILKFEPISRDHPGLVHVLHVGRSDGASPFYYYVMELGDDAYFSEEFNPVEYEPRTLRTDMVTANHVPLDTEFVITTGRRLAEALDHLHERNLTHRDVKPSNVIFVEGNAKLADIGLVATMDQRTFVGTEGFVPPEGPGSTGADVYSLGKVLYEMATGMDRLQFPELPEDGPPEKDRKKWIELNRLLCDVCEPRIGKRKTKTAAQLADALERLERGKRVRRPVAMATWVMSALFFVMSLFAAQLTIEHSWGSFDIEGKREALPIRYTTAKIQTETEDGLLLDGVDVYDFEGELLGPSSLKLSNLRVGERLQLKLRKDGFLDATVDVELMGDESQTTFIPVQMVRFSPPVADESWQDALGLEYSPLDERHISGTHVTSELWDVFAEEEQIPDQVIRFTHSESGRDIEIVAVPESLAKQYVLWLTGKCLEEGFLATHSDETLDKNREIKVSYDRKFPEERLPQIALDQGLRPFRCLVQIIPYATVSFQSTPEGALIYIDGRLIGNTNLPNYVVPPGQVNFTIELEGYDPHSGYVQLNDRGHEQVDVSLKENEGAVVFGENARVWKNSLGMRLAPLGEDLMVSIWQTRAADYEPFMVFRQQKWEMEFSPESPNHPAVGITREEAEEFCEWLTERERGLERIQTQHRYRLLTDLEWSQAAGIEEQMEQPIDREADIQNEEIYPWGTQVWPPPKKVGNYADQSAADSESIEVRQTIEGYNDGFAEAAPVGRFPANAIGLHDLGGNVKEWVSDAFKKGEEGAKRGVLRGADWKSYDPAHLELRHRAFVSPQIRSVLCGFRVVLAKEDDQEQKIPEVEVNENGGDTN